ncbi:MAG: DMT family transporter [Nanobdellota archaeon]
MRKFIISILGAIAIIFSASLWGIDSAFLRPMLYNCDYFVIVFLEHLVAFTFMLPFFIYEIKEVKKMDWKDWVSISLVALFGGAIGTLAITKAFFSVFLNNISSVSVIVLLQKTQPIFAILLAMLILRERPKLLFFPLAFIALIGSYLVAFGFKIPSLETDVMFVPALALLASFSFATGTVFGRRVVKKLSFRMTTYLRFLITSFIMLILIALFNRFAGFSSVGLPDLGVILLIAFTTGGAAIIIYYWGLKRVMASKAAIYELGFPLTAVILDYFIHNETMNIGQWLGAILIISAMWFIIRLNKTK